MSAAVLTPTQRTVWYRMRRLARIALLHFLIHCDEWWLKDCDPDGALTTDQLTAVRLRLQELRVDLAIAEASMKSPIVTERPDVNVVRIIKPRGEVLERISEPAELGMLDVPQPTEPMHIGALFREPPPRRAGPWHRPSPLSSSNPWIVRAIGYALLLVLLLAVGVVGALSIGAGQR